MSELGQIIAVVSLVSTYTLVLVWLIRLEGKVSTNDALHRTTLEELRYLRRRFDRFTDGGQEEDNEHRA